MAVIGFDPQTYDVIESVGFVIVTVRAVQGFLGRDIVVTLQTNDGTTTCKWDKYLSGSIH